MNKKYAKLISSFVLACLLPALCMAQKPNPVRTCPPISAISKDPAKLTWSAQDGFKSYEMSFIDQLTTFLGAQWNGVKVGQVTCVYSGKPKTAFPILLVYGTLAIEPTGGKWSKNLDGIRN